MVNTNDEKAPLPDFPNLPTELARKIAEFDAIPAEERGGFITSAEAGAWVRDWVGAHIPLHCREDQPQPNRTE